MASKTKSKWPPPGWKVEIKVSFNGRHYKCYTNSKTGEKLYSKVAVLRCIKKGKRSNQESQSRGAKQHPKTKTGNKKMHLLEANDSLNLPPGWTVEWKVRQSGAAKGTKYKCITDPSTGSKFYSMPEVSRYLKSRKGRAGSSKHAKGESITNSKNNSTGVKFHSKLGVRRYTNQGNRSNRKSQSQGTKQHTKNKTINKKLHVNILETNDSLNLPYGWTLEWKVIQSGPRKGTKYKCITDPSTGSKFYSMGEVDRYLKSRKGSAGSSKKSKEESIVNSENNPTPSSNIKKTGKSSKRKHFIDEESPKQSTLLPLVTIDSNQTPSKRITRSSWKTQPVSNGLEKIPLLPGPAKTLSKMVRSPPSGEVSAVHGQNKRITRSYSNVQSATSLPKSPTIVSSAGTLGKRTTTQSSANMPQDIVPVKPEGEVSSVEVKSKRSTRLSSKVEASPSYEPNVEKISSLSEPGKTAREIVPAKSDEVSPIGAQSKRITRSTKVDSSYFCGPTLEKSPVLPEPAKEAREIVTAKQVEGVPSTGSQSKRRTRSTSSKVQSVSSCGPSFEQIPVSSVPDQGCQQMGPAKIDLESSSVVGAQSKKTRSYSKVQTPFTYKPNLEQMSLVPEPETLEIFPAKLNGAVFAAEAIDDVRSNIHDSNVKQSNAVPKETKPSTFLKPKSDAKLKGPTVRKTRVNKSTSKDRKVFNMSSRSSKKLAESSAKTNVIPEPYLVPNEPHQTLDDGQQNVVMSQPKLSWAFDINTPSVEKIDYIPHEYIEEIFFKEDTGPPGFSQYPRSKITQSTIDQLFEDPFDPMPEDSTPKSPTTTDPVYPINMGFEKSPEKHVISEEQQTSTSSTMKTEEPSRNSVLEHSSRNNEQSGSEFCMPSQLWSDPCLEFAFKTLTGALPLDDNAVIQDFMDHQLRSNDQVSSNHRTPDIGMSSFCQNDETKVAPPPLPDDVGFTKPNGFQLFNSRIPDDDVGVTKPNGFQLFNFPHKPKR